MDDVWSWIGTLPSSIHCASHSSPDSPILPLAASGDRSILLRAERTAGSDAEALLTFSLCIHGFHPTNPDRTLWVSDPCPLSSPSSSRLLLLLQLLNEVISLSPSLPHLGSYSSSLNLERELVSRALDAAAEEAPAFFSLVLLLRLFWLCACDAPANAGFLLFRDLLSPAAVDRALGCRRALRGFFLAVGPDAEDRVARSLGYMLTKWFLLRELHASVAAPRRLPAGSCPSYAAERHGLWVLKGYAPVLAMAHCGGARPGLEAEESLLRYALAHQQLEAVVQLEYMVCMRDPRFIRVVVRVDNVRLHMVQLRFCRRRNEEEDYASEVEEEEKSSSMEGERHFPSRLQIWVGPERGAAYATGPSLGRSSGNPEREVETTRTVKGLFPGGIGKSSGATVKAKARSSARAPARSWLWEQEAEGSLGLWVGVLCDTMTGAEVAAWRPPAAGSGRGGADVRGGMRRRSGGSWRAFTKAGGVVVAGDQLPESVNWRVGRELEGRRVRWRVGGKVWVSYFPNEVRSGFFETRCVEWNEEVELDLVAGAETTRS